MGKETNSQSIEVSSGTQLEYEVMGTGEPILYIHGALVHHTHRPLAGTKLTNRYQLVGYTRVNYPGSSEISQPVSLSDQAQHAAKLLSLLGIQRAHIVGHSYGGCVAIELFRSHPDQVHSLTLLEPGLLFLTPNYQAVLDKVRQGYQQIQQGNQTQIADQFIQGWGPYAFNIIDTIIPGSIATARENCRKFFESELPALEEWDFAVEDIQKLLPPTLAVVGEHASANAKAIHKLLMDNLIHANEVIIPAVGHLLHIAQPKTTARHISEFLEQHPI